MYSSKLQYTVLKSTRGCTQGCSSVLFFEARKKKDLYVWLAKAPEGPSVKFYVTNGVCCLDLGMLIYSVTVCQQCALQLCGQVKCVRTGFSVTL